MNKKYFLFTALTFFLIQIAQAQAPKLVVGVVVDQMRYDYLYRFAAKYQPDGFKRLMKNGANCKNAHYNYVPTYTAPGHASIYTGSTPSGHGIVGNSWYSREEGKIISNVKDTSVNLLGTQTTEGRSPLNLKLQTFTDALKLANEKAKVYSISIKDRGAILPGGHMADGAFWYDYKTGNFYSSSYYLNDIPVWLQNFNATQRVDEFMNGSWNTFYPIDQYTESRADDVEYEATFPGNKDAAFPHDLHVLKGEQKYAYFPLTPFANGHLTDLAMQVLKAENLGKDEVTDILALSYSTPDLIGHSFGPYSKEIEDCYIRLDMDIARLLRFLDEEMGEGEYTLFLTADHAVAPIPQYLQEKKLDAGFFYTDSLNAEIESFLKAKYGENLLLSNINQNLYLDRDKIQALGLEEDVVNKSLASFLQKIEGIQYVFTAHQLMYAANHDNAIMTKVAKGYDYQRSGDVIYVLAPNYLSKKNSASSHKGTTHGSPYAYDSHVPLLFYGANIEPGEVLDKIAITDICPTICTLLNLQFPNGNEGELIKAVLKH